VLSPPIPAPATTILMRSRIDLSACGVTCIRGRLRENLARTEATTAP
jgi:hypothetical protein